MFFTKSKMVALLWWSWSLAINPQTFNILMHFFEIIYFKIDSIIIILKTKSFSIWFQDVYILVHFSTDSTTNGSFMAAQKASSKALYFTSRAKVMVSLLESLQCGNANGGTFCFVELKRDLCLRTCRIFFLFFVPRQASVKEQFRSVWGLCVGRFFSLSL